MKSDNETPTSNAFTDMWNLKKGQMERLCRTDADSQTLNNLWGMGDVLGLWDGNPVKLDCDDHDTTTDVINSFA